MICAQDLPADQGAVPYIHAKFPHMKEQEIRSHLGGFGITGKLALQPMQTLSGGQKVRFGEGCVKETVMLYVVFDSRCAVVRVRARLGSG